MSAAPSRQRGPGDAGLSGDIWVHSLDSRSGRLLTSGGGYRSPIFLARDEHILSLKNGSVVRIPVAGGAEQRLFDGGEIVRLVGVSTDSPDDVLVVREGRDKRLSIGMLSLAGGLLTPIPHETETDEGRAVLAQLTGSSRTYCHTQLYVEEECARDEAGGCRKDDEGREKRWTDVKLQVAYKDPSNISNCGGTNCGQPSLSLDGRAVVFVKEAR